MNEAVWNEHETRIRELADMILKGYKRTSLINSENRVLTPITLEQDAPGNFLQFAYRTKIPLSVFKNNIDNGMVAHHFSNSIETSEKRYLLTELEKSQDKRDIGELENVSYEEFQRIINSLNFTPTDIFIPIKIYTEMMKFYRENRISRGGYYSSITVNSNNVRIHWSTKALDFDKIYIFDKSGIVWKQKKVKDMGLSRAKDPPYERLLTDENDILQISAGVMEDEQISFLMRLVALSTINKNKVKLLKINEESLESRKLVEKL